MLTISFLSSSDMDELSISSGVGRGVVALDAGNYFALTTCHCRYIQWEFTCVVLLFITNTENGLHPAVRFANAVAAAHMPKDEKQQGNIKHRVKKVKTINACV